MVLEEEVVLIEGEGKQQEKFVEEKCDKWRRDGGLGGLGEELGVIDLLTEVRQHPRADTNECGVMLRR